MKLSDIIEINPRLSLMKGSIAPFIEMGALPIDSKFIQKIGERKVTGSGAKFQNDDTLFARITPCLENGKGGFVAGLPENSIGHGSTEFIVFRAKEKRDVQFVYYLSRYFIFRSYAEQNMKGTSGRQRVSWQVIADYELRNIGSEERQSIGQVLSCLDDKIELNRRMNETLEEMARALFRDWFVDFGPTRRQMEGATDPVAIMGNAFPAEKAAELAPLFPAKLGEEGLPEGWKNQPFEAFVEIVGGGTPKTKVTKYWGGDIPWFSVVDAPDKGGVYVFSTEKNITKAGLENSSARTVPEGTTIISARGTVGKIAMASGDMTFNQSCYALRPKAPVGERFVYLATERLVERLKAMAHGSVFSTVTRATFANLNFAGATSDIFAEFEETTTNIFSKIQANGQENQTLAEMRDLLLPKLMSGEICLKAADDAIEELSA